jgi:hypothetical protein
MKYFVVITLSLFLAGVVRADSTAGSEPSATSHSTKTPMKKAHKKKAMKAFSHSSVMSSSATQTTPTM